MKNLTQQLDAFKNNIIMNEHGNVGESAYYNFWDWFCSDCLLPEKAQKIFKLVRKFVKLVRKFVNLAKIDTESVYVTFKNNLPLSGPGYDSIQFVDIESGSVKFWMTPKSGHTGLAEFTDLRNHYDITASKPSELLKLAAAYINA